MSVGGESATGQWGRQRRVSESDSRNVVSSDESRRVDLRETKWPVASDLKLDRRPNVFLTLYF